MQEMGQVIREVFAIAPTMIGLPIVLGVVGGLSVKFAYPESERCGGTVFIAVFWSLLFFAGGVFLSWVLLYVGALTFHLGIK